MTEQDKRKLGAILWAIADQLRDPMNADGFRHYMLSFLFLCYLSDNYESAGRKSAYTLKPSLSLGEGRL